MLRETEHCALKLTIFIIWAQAFVGYSPLRQVQWNLIPLHLTLYLLFAPSIAPDFVPSICTFFAPSIAPDEVGSSPRKLVLK